MNMVPGATAALAEFIARNDLASLPSVAHERAQRVIADSLACMLAGAGSELSASMRTYLDEAGPGPCPVIGTRRSASPQAAAFANGTHGAALDYDDLLGSLHASVVIVAALVSALGTTPVSGREFVEAYIVGIEVGAKLAKALGKGHPQRGYHVTATLSGFAAFAAVARLQGLDPRRVAKGLSLVATQASGLLCQLGTTAKPMHSGFAARIAVDVVRLLAAGFDAAPDALEARRGLFETLGDECSDPGALAASLGHPWAVVEPGSTLKQFASSVAGHRAMAAVLELKHQGLSADNAASIDCAVAPGALRPMGHPRPRNAFESKFSMPYAIATALLDDRLGIASFETAATQRPAALALMERIHAWEDPQQAIEDPVSANLSWGYRGYARVTARLNDGRTLSARVDVAPGSPSKPLSWDDLRQKYIDCASCAGIGVDEATDGFERLQVIDRCDDMRQLLQHLQPAAPL
jgi:2-methylcitrate dehydratase PrpD